MVGVSQVKEILALIDQGWRPYNEQPQHSVYESLSCTIYEKKRPAWFVKGDKFVCITCSKKCALFRPAGFRPPIPVRYDEKKMGGFALTPRELAMKKELLNMREICYCLNVSYQKAYGWVKEGRLTCLKDMPIRVRASEVLAMMDDFDESWGKYARFYSAKASMQVRDL